MLQEKRFEISILLRRVFRLPVLPAARAEERKVAETQTVDPDEHAHTTFVARKPQ